MKIILGVFDTSFGELMRKHNLLSYGDGSIWQDQLPVPDHISNYIIETVSHASYQANEIYFDITNIDLELTHSSFERLTIRELTLIMITPEYLNKTRFFRDGIEIPKDDVVNWFLFNDYWDQFLN